MSFLPQVLEAKYRGAYRIHLVFNDRSTGTVDFRRWLKGPVFQPLKDLDFFRRFFVEGGTVVWPNGADLAPEALYRALARRTQPNKRLKLARRGGRQKRKVLS